MFEYVVEKPEMVKLKDEVLKYSDIAKKRMERLYSILGDVEVSIEYIKAYLDYFSYTNSKREDLLFTKDALLETYSISASYPNLSSKAIKLIMGEYVKDLFDEVKPLSYFDGMNLRQMDDSFDRFMHLLRLEADKSDLPYIEEEQKIEALSNEYGKEFIDYIKKFAVKYHKTFDEIFYSIPVSSLIKPDVDMFYEEAKKELFGYIGYPYSFLLSKSMILFDGVDAYTSDDKLMYNSSRKGSFEAPFTASEFLESVESKRKEIRKM